MMDEFNFMEDDIPFGDDPPVEDVNAIEHSLQTMQAPLFPNEDNHGALQEEDIVLPELEDAPIASMKKKKTIDRGPKLDTKRLLESRGLPDVPKYFENVQLKGKGHEVADLNIIMTKFEHWAHRLYPKWTFDDCLEKIEALGHKKEIQTCLKKIRMGMPIMDEFQSTVITADGPASLEHNEEDTFEPELAENAFDDDHAIFAPVSDAF